MSDAAEKVPPTFKRTLPAGMIPWKPGQTGNPTGKNGVTALMQRIREATGNGELLVAVLKDALQDSSKLVRLRAVEILFERGWGKAFQPIHLTGEQPILDLSKWPPEKVEAFLRLLVELTQNGTGPIEPPTA